MNGFGNNPKNYESAKRYDKTIIKLSFYNEGTNLKIRSQFMLYGVFIVLIPMLISTLVATGLVLNQNEKDARERIGESTRRITHELKTLEAQYSDRVQKFAKTDNIVMYTNVLYKYHSYLTDEGYTTIQKAMEIELSKLRIGLNVDVIEVFDANDNILARNASAVNTDTDNSHSRKDVAHTNILKKVNDEPIEYLVQDERFILKATAIISKKGRTLGYLVLTRYLNSNYLKEVSIVNGTEVAFFMNNTFLDGTVQKFAVRRIKTHHPVQLKIQKAPYSFIFSPVYQKGKLTFYIAVGASSLGTIQKIAQTRNILIGVALFAVLMALLLAYFWSGKTVAPLLRLVSAVKAAGQGELGQRIRVESSNEIGMLASEFNKMTTSLKDSHGQLEAANRNLFDMKEYISNIVESMTMSIVVIDKDYHITVANSEFEKTIGKRRQEIIGILVGEIIELSDDSQDFQEHLHWVMGSFETKILTKIHCRVGEHNIISNLRLSPMLEGEKQLVGAVIIIEDITARVNLEEELTLSQRLAAIGKLAAGLAHEINNPLGIILNYIEICQMDEKDEKVKGYLMRITSETERIAEIIRQLLEFSRQTKTQFRPVDLIEVVDDTIDFIEYKLRKEGIRLQKRYSLSKAMVLADKSQLKQVFLNIILNALQAMQHGGRLTIRLHETDDGQAFSLSFIDSGKGIAKEILDKVFDPFFSTKAIGEGTGLGLSVSYGIIQEHAGSIEVTSKEGTGSTFTIKLKKITILEEGVADVPSNHSHC
jgi:PAS domain S-box-containing protein